MNSDQAVKKIKNRLRSYNKNLNFNKSHEMFGIKNISHVKGNKSSKICFWGFSYKYIMKNIGLAVCFND